MSAPANNHNDDVNDWVNRFKAVAAKPDIITGASPPGRSAWHNPFFACFDPIDTCLITYCCPCITFGKTHYRLRKDPSMKGYEPLNASCFGWWVSACFGLHWAPQLLQRHDIREKYNLDGEFAVDCFKACCCTVCDLVQQDKEAAYQALSNNEMVIAEQPQKQLDGMSYPVKNGGATHPDTVNQM